VIVLVEAVLQVVETELVATGAASHVIAPFVFIDSDRAFGTLHSSVVALPLREFGVLLRFTTLLPRVRFLPTGKADFSVTRFTLGFRIFPFGPLSHDAAARGARAPSQVWIQVDHCVVQESTVLNKVLVGDHLLDIAFFELAGAPNLHAANVDHFARVNLAVQVVLLAEPAEGVFAR